MLQLFTSEPFLSAATLMGLLACVQLLRPRAAKLGLGEWNFISWKHRVDAREIPCLYMLASHSYKFLVDSGHVPHLDNCSKSLQTYICTGTAYVHGLKHASGDFVIIMDADLSHHVSTLFFGSLSVYVFDHVFESDVAQDMCRAGSEDWMSIVVEAYWNVVDK